MSYNREFLFRVFFRLRVHQTAGNEFQGLFSQVMQYSDPRFQSIVPWGTWGDGGNDGWIPEDGHYFQVYGPKATTTDTATIALGKAISDFPKLGEKWKLVRKYHFVFNDRFDGIPAPIASALQRLQIKEKLTEARAMETKELLARFMALQDDCRLDIVGGIPEEEVDFVNAGAMGELLSGLTALSAEKTRFLTETAPDFEEKIVFNGIGAPVAARLRASSYQVSLVDDFLTTAGTGSKQALSEEVKKLYQRSKSAIPDNEGAPSERYFWMIEELIPKQTTLKSHRKTAYRTAAEVVLAKYFETCDAYEHPNSSATT